MTIERLTIEDFTGDFMACPPRFRVDRRAPADITARMELGSRKFQYGFVPNCDVIATPLEFRHGIAFTARVDIGPVRVAFEPIGYCVGLK
jgi:hypothetical protein